MRILVLSILMTCIGFSCYPDVENDVLEGNIFDKDYEGVLIKDVEFIFDFSFYSDCYVDVYFRLTEDAIESMLAVNTGTTKTLGAISAFIDGTRAVTLYSTDSRFDLESRIRIDNVRFTNSITEKSLEIYVEREIFQNPENQRTLIETHQFSCEE